MAQEYGIGGTERPTDASEAISDIQQNRTLMVEKLTADDAIKPEIIEGLTTVDAVFDHFKPSCETEFATEDGAPVKETLSFSTLGDFGTKGITNQSSFLKGLNNKQEELEKVIKQLRSNKLLVKAMQDPESKAAFISSLQGLIGEIDDAVE